MRFPNPGLTPELPVPGQMLLGRYVIEGLIGRGAFSAVYRGRQLGVERTVAIKCLDPKATQLDPAAQQRFAREARLISGLEHPNTITVFDYGRTEKGILFLVMEYVEGITLTRLMQSGRLDGDRAARLVKQVLLSLREAHYKGIIHRDLKPANIMICERAGERDVVKVLDFGIAKALNNPREQRNLTVELTGRDKMIGTPRYMSPEQIKAEPLSPCADLYTVGLIFFELLAGRPAIEADSAMAQISVQLSYDPIEIPSDGTVSDKYYPIVEKAIEKDPNRRYKSADDFLQAIEAVLDVRPTFLPGAGGHRSRAADTMPLDVKKIRKLAEQVDREHQRGQLGPAAAFAGPAASPRSVMVMNVLLAAVLLLVGLTLGILIVQLLQREPLPTPSQQIAAAPAESPPAAAPAVEPAPAPVSSSATPAPARTRVADPRIEVGAGQMRVHSALGTARTAVEPVDIRFSGRPAEADVFMGVRRLGSTGQTIELVRSELPNEIEIRQDGYMTEYIWLGRSASGTFHYDLRRVQFVDEPVAAREEAAEEEETAALEAETAGAEEPVAAQQEADGPPQVVEAPTPAEADAAEPQVTEPSARRESTGEEERSRREARRSRRQEASSRETITAEPEEPSRDADSGAAAPLIPAFDEVEAAAEPSDQGAEGERRERSRRSRRSRSSEDDEEEARERDDDRPQAEEPSLVIDAFDEVDSSAPSASSGDEEREPSRRSRRRSDDDEDEDENSPEEAAPEAVSIPAIDGVDEGSEGGAGGIVPFD